MSRIPTAILAGGLGTRLRAAVADRPKVLADVGGRPFLCYLLDRLVEHEVREVILCVGYLGEQVHARFGSSYGRLRLAYSQELSPLGTAGALRLAFPLLHSEHILVINGDSFCDVDLGAFLAWHNMREANGSLVLVKRFDTKHSGRVEVQPDGRITSFEEKGKDTGPGWINAGVYLLTRQLLETIPATGAVSLERELFPMWIKHGLYGYQTDGRLLDIGTPESYALAEQFLLPIETSRLQDAS